MKHYTLDWWLSLQSPSSTRNDAPRLDEEAFNRIRPQLPDHIAALWTTDFHDAHPRQLSLDNPASRLVILLDCNGPEGELIRRRLTFEGVRSLDFAADPDAGLIGPHGFGDLGYWEVDVAERAEGEASAAAAFEFRALFSTGIEMRVRFMDVRIEIA